jgi:hypothetical protein
MKTSRTRRTRAGASEERQTASAKSSIIPESPSREAIAQRAHQLFLSRGGVHGHDLDDWLEAERQIRTALREV